MTFLEPLQAKLGSLWVSTVKLLPMLGIALVVLLITWIAVGLLSRLLRGSMQRTHLRPSLKALLDNLLRVTLWSVGFLIAVTVVFPSLTPAKLLTALGLGSVAVGLAFKDIFENFFAGILIMLRKPMNIGDFVQCEGVEGRVEQISVRETYIRQIDDQLILVPNSFLFKNPLYILTDKAQRRFDIVVGVAYGEDVDRAREVIAAALHGLSLVDESRGVEVYAASFNSSSIDFTVRWWAASTPIDLHRSRDQVVAAIKRALDEANIEIPFPCRTLTFKEPLSLTRADAEAP